jgi:hypothetical protein
MGQCVNKLTGQSGISDQEIGFEWRLGRKGARGGELRSRNLPGFLNDTAGRVSELRSH